MPAILRPDEHMQVVTYTGTGAAQTLYCGFKPDLVWIKSRSATTSHKLTNSVRGVTKGLISNTTGTETTDTNGVTAFTDTGFTIGSDSNYNTNGATYVAWCWKAGQGVTSTNISGSITSTVSANPTAGFSVVTYTGTGVNATVGHGLGVAPSWIIVKAINQAYNWNVYSSSLANTQFLRLNTTDSVQAGPTLWNSTSPTSSVFSLGTSLGVNGSGDTHVAYCWAPIEGYSAFGKYTGNGSTDGTFVNTGFRPRWLLIKSSSNAQNWTIFDTTRDLYNPSGKLLYPLYANAEETDAGQVIDIVSNGFKIRGTNVNQNGSGYTYIYAAFAENPLKYANAR